MDILTVKERNLLKQNKKNAKLNQGFYEHARQRKYDLCIKNSKTKIGYAEAISRIESILLN